MELFNNDINYTNIRNTTSYKTIVQDLLNIGVKENDKVDNADVEIFKSQAHNVLTKINFLNVLNNHNLFNKITKI